MPNQDGGFLTEEQRRFIDSQTDSPLPSSFDYNARKAEKANNPNRRKLELQEKFRQPHNLAQLIDSFFLDLQRIRDYHVEIEEPAGNYDEWTEWVLPEIKNQITRLKQELDTLERLAESDQFRKHHKEVEYILNTTLFSGLGIATGNRIVYPEDSPKFNKRKAGFKYFIEHDHPTEIWELFDSIEGNPGQRISGKEKIGGNHRQWHANKRLRRDFGLIEWYGDGAWEDQFELTERGQAVHTAISSLLESDVVNQMLAMKYIEEFEAVYEAVQRFSTQF